MVGDNVLLVRHGAVYVVARGLPGIINFLALIIYTRLLSPEQYGLYALVIAGIGLVQIIYFQWLGLCLARFLPANRSAPEDFLSEIKFLFIILALGFICVSLIVVCFLWSDSVWRNLMVFAVPVCLCSAWFELNLFYATTALKPKLYGRINLTKAILSLLLGASLAYLGVGVYAPLFGLLLGMGTGIFVFRRKLWVMIKPKPPNSARMKSLLQYGIPLAINLALTWVVTSSDRFLLGLMLGVDVGGQYAVGYDLAQYSVGMLLMIVNLAAYPLVIQVFERDGTEAARIQLRQNGVILTSIALLSASFLAVLAPLFGDLLVGSAYKNATIKILPWIAFAAALTGLKSYYFDVAFLLGKATKKLVWISLCGALLNIVLNIICIPLYGILGAVYATVVTYIITLVGSSVIGRRYFVLPDFSPIFFSSLIIVIPSSIAVWGGMQYGGWGGLCLGISAGGCTGILFAICFDFAGLRCGLLNWIQS